MQLRTDIMHEIIEAPVWLGIKFAEMTDALLDGSKPQVVARIGLECIEGDQYLARGAIDDNTEPTVAASFAGNGLAGARP